MPDPDAQADPGSVEFAAEIKEAVGNRFARMKEGMRGGQDLVTVIFSCGYEQNTCFCFGMDGDPSNIVATLAVAIVQLAELSYTQLQKREKFLPIGNQTPFDKVAAEIAKEVLIAVRNASHDRKIDKPSGIITPDTNAHP